MAIIYLALPRISIIVPVYNTEAYIDKCLVSLTGQTMQELEFIFVDDRGSDQSMEIVRRYAEKDARIRVITNEKNLGAGESRNAGLRIATGEYIAFIDSDDSINADYFDILYQLAITENADIAKGTYILVWHDRQLLSDMNPKIHQRIKQHEFIGIAFTHAFWNAIYRRTMLQDNHIDFPNLPIGEDCIFLTKALCAAQTISISDKAVLYYYQRSDSAGKTITQQYYDSLFKHYEILVSILKHNNISTHDLIEYWYHAIFNPLRYYHLPLIKDFHGDKDSLYSFIAKRMQTLFLMNDVFDQMQKKYPDSSYEIIGRTPHQASKDALNATETLLPQLFHQEQYHISLFGIPFFEIKSKALISRIKFFGIPIIKIIKTI